MITNDNIHRFIFEDCDIRGEIVTLAKSVQTIQSHNDNPAHIQQLLGEFVVAAALLSSTLKFEGTITLQAQSAGPISLIMAECTHHNNLRGVVRVNHEQLDVDKQQSLQELLPNAVLAITISPEKGERYQGVVALSGETLAECLEEYFKQSEQLATRIWIFANAQQAGGLLLQALPQQLATSFEENSEHWQTITTLSETISGAELFSVAHETLLYRLYHEHPLRLFEPRELQFLCSCSYERSADALKSLGKEDVVQLLEEKNIIEIDCQFCNQLYKFDALSIRELFSINTLH